MSFYGFVWCEIGSGVVGRCAWSGCRRHIIVCNPMFMSFSHSESRKAYGYYIRNICHNCGTFGLPSNLMGVVHGGFVWIGLECVLTPICLLIYSYVPGPEFCINFVFLYLCRLVWCVSVPMDMKRMTDASHVILGHLLFCFGFYFILIISCLYIFCKPS